MNKLRVPCYNGCGRMVLIERGSFCRKCRRKIAHAELKMKKKLEKQNKKI